jgi:hypothetical protein
MRRSSYRSWGQRKSCVTRSSRLPSLDHRMIRWSFPSLPSAVPLHSFKGLCFLYFPRLPHALSTAVETAYFQPLFCFRRRRCVRRGQPLRWGKIRCLFPHPLLGIPPVSPCVPCRQSASRYVSCSSAVPQRSLRPRKARRTTKTPSKTCGGAPTTTPGNRATSRCPPAPPLSRTRPS